MNRAEALALINTNVKNQNTLKHMLATEAIMRALPRGLIKPIVEARRRRLASFSLSPRILG